MAKEPSNAIYPLNGWPLKLTVHKILKSLNFEFMDLEVLPNSLRAVLRDILEVGNGAPFRRYYQWTSKSVYEYAIKNNIKEIVELGAGCAPITRHLIQNFPNWEISFKITDLNPDIVNFKILEKKDNRVQAVFESIDFSKKLKGFENSLLVLSATFHHIDEKQKTTILKNLKAISPHVLIFEPLRPTMPSFLFVLGAIVSGLLTPLFRIKSKSFFRCFLWCWLLPIAPLMFLWDGWISAWRCWGLKKWQTQEPKSIIKESLFCTQVLIVR